MQRHAHNWAITTESFNSYRSLLDFWHVLAVDDGLPQGYPENHKNEKEFPIILQSKTYPISAWLTHPECPFTKFHSDEKGLHINE